MTELTNENIPIVESGTVDESHQDSEGGHIRNVGMLDLTFAKMPEDLSKIKSFTNVGLVLVPEHLSHVVASIKTENVGMVVPIPVGDNVNTITGQTKISGEALAGGDSETILVIVGQVIITTPVTKVGYKGLIVVGQVCAPRGSEGVLASGIKQLTGQIIYYPEGARFFWGDTNISCDFLKFLTMPTAFVVIGNMIFAEDITVEQVQSKISEFVLFGLLDIPRHLESITQFLTTEKMGEIRVRE